MTRRRWVSGEHNRLQPSSLTGLRFHTHGAVADVLAGSPKSWSPSGDEARAAAKPSDVWTKEPPSSIFRRRRRKLTQRETPPSPVQVEDGIKARQRQQDQEQAKVDSDHALVLCHQWQFDEGELHLLRERRPPRKTPYHQHS